MTMLEQILDDYLKLFPGERAELANLLQQVVAGGELNNRKTLPGHVTGSAIVLSPDRTKILLVNHRFLQRWLQPGGHWEADEPNPLEAAKREVVEETGVRLAEYLPLLSDEPLAPFDIEQQDIPDRPDRHEPSHVHYDFRYVFIASEESIEVTEHQIVEAGWFGFDAPECENIPGIIRKLRSASIIQA